MKILFIACYSPLINNSASIETLQYLNNLAKEGNEEATNLLYQKYKPIIVSKSKDAIVSANHHGIEINDIMQEGYIGLEEAIKSFNEIILPRFR